MEHQKSHPSSLFNAPCGRCGDAAAIKGRNAPLCRACFVSYVRTKIIKRMEQFRVRNAEPDKTRTLLLPLSLGISSVSLLYVLDAHLSSQFHRTGRTGFKLHVLHVQSPEEDTVKADAKLQSVQERFSRHTYSSIPLMESLEDPDCQEDPHTNGQRQGFEDVNEGLHAENKYSRLISSIQSVTSKTDVLNILRTRAIVSFSRQHQCEGIFWGDSTTKLAEKVLSETAKGRGFSLPWQIADGDSPWGLPFYYPMRDLLKKELGPFSSWIEPPIDSLVYEAGVLKAAPAASKNGSIDILMRQYFASVEEQYPSIVANVVRTTGKLKASTAVGTGVCKLCSMPLTSGTTRTQAARLQASVDMTGLTTANANLCYGCAQTLPQELLVYLTH